MSDQSNSSPDLIPAENFLDHYFANVYQKLEADALLFNRKIPHAGLVGSENEAALGMLLRDFLPPRFGVEVGGIIVDKYGRTSKQIDIIIYDAAQPKFFRKVFPIEIVYTAIEVKTSMGQPEATASLANMKALNMLDFRPALSNFWETQTREKKLHHSPPSYMIFAYRTNCESFETFTRWFPWGALHEGTPLRDAAPTYPEIRVLRVAALDQGIIQMESTNGYVLRMLAAAATDDIKRGFDTTLMGQKIKIDPAKALFLFLNRLWFDLEQHHMHPGFDIRSYLSAVLGSVIRVEEEHLAG